MDFPLLLPLLGLSDIPPIGGRGCGVAMILGTSLSDIRTRFWDPLKLVGDVLSMGLPREPSIHKTN